MNIDYVQMYIDKVESGEFKVGRRIQLAIDRHKSDLEKSKDPSFPYEYRPELTYEPIDFIDMLPDPKSSKRVGLALFQKFIIAMIFGWVKKDSGYRRFTKVVISMSRKNGKSLLIAGIALYELLYETAPMASRQVYSTANTKEQASICFKMIKTQLQAVRRKSKAVREFTKVNKYDIETKDDSFCKALASDSSVLDGLDVCCSIFDEMAENKDTSIIEVIESSQSQQMQPLNLMISTTSANLTGHYHMEEYPLTMKVLTGDVEADHYLALWWEMDEMSEADNEDNWMKSNPLFEKPEVRENMLAHKRAKLKEGTAKGNLTNFLTKELNFWVSDEATAFVSKQEWMECKTEERYDIRGKEVYIGVDLARVGDLTAVTWVIPLVEEQKFLVDSHAWVATTNGGIIQKEANDRTPYRQYAKQGYCEISTRPDGQADWEDMLNWIMDFIESNDLDVKAIAYDPAQSQLLTTRLSDFGYEDVLFDVRQSYMRLNPPTKQLQVDIRAKKIVHYDNPLLTRSIYNGYVKESNDLIMIDKQMNRNKIDPLDALINAYSEAYFYEFEEQNWSELYANGALGFGL